MTPLKVLFLEDSPSDRDITRLQLEHVSPGRFRFTAAGDLSSALAALKGGSFDVVLADLNLPDSKGVATIHALMEAGCKAPVIAFTGDLNAGTGIDAVNAGATDFVTKGVTDAMTLGNRIAFAARRGVNTVPQGALEGLVTERTSALDETLVQLKATHAELAEQTRRQDLFMAAVPYCFFLQDAKTAQLVFVSPAYETIFHRSLATLATNPLDWLAVVHPDDRGWVRDAFSSQAPAPRVDQQSRVVDPEFRIVDPDGSLRWIRVTWIPIQAKGAIPAHRAGVIQDVTQDKRTQATLQSNEQLLNEAQEIAKIGGWEYDVATTAVRWTREVYRIHEVPETFNPNRAAEDIQFYVEKDRPIINAALKDAVEKGVPFDLELKLMTARGNLLDVRSTGTATLKDGRVTRVHGHIADITQQKRAEQRLRAAHADAQRLLTESQLNERRFRALLEHGTDSISVIDANNHILYLSPSVEAVEGYTAAELEGRNGLENTHPDDVPKVKAIVAELLAKPGAPVACLWRRRHKDGHWMLLEGVATNLLGDPAVNGIVTNYRDVTERQRVAEALRASEAKYRFLAENIADLIVASAPEGNWTYVSPSAKALLGYEPAELIGKRSVELIHPDDVAALSAVRTKVIAEAIPAPHRFRFRRKDGSHVWVESRTTPVKGADGKVVSLISLIRDATERIEGEAAQRQMAQNLEKKVVERTTDLTAANKELEAFAYSISHDLRAPLRSMDGFSKILLDEYKDVLPAEGQHYLQMVIDSTAEMARLVEAILQFSRAGRHELNRQTVDPASAVAQVMDELKPAVAGRDVQVQVGELPALQADATLLRQVYANLLSNAVKFSRGRTTALIEVGSIAKDGETVYFVKDNGAGFDMKYVSKLFGMFQRLHSTAEFEGNGIGLAIVKRIVERHGGKVWAQGEVGKGAQFFFTIPAAPVASAADPAARGSV